MRATLEDVLAADAPGKTAGTSRTSGGYQLDSNKTAELTLRPKLGACRMLSWAARRDRAFDEREAAAARDTGGRMEFLTSLAGGIWSTRAFIAFLLVLTLVVFIHELGPLPRGALVRRHGQGLLDRLWP